MNKNLIYGLKCPFTKEIHYIGKTTQGMLRPLQHLSKSQNEKVREWVNSLKELGHAPGIEIIEDNINIEELDDKEKFWINHFLLLLFQFLVKLQKVAHPNYNYLSLLVDDNILEIPKL